MLQETLLTTVPREPRNTPLAKGVSSLSRSASYQKKALFKRNKKLIQKTPIVVESAKTVPVKGAKNGKTRLVSKKLFYPAEDIKSLKKSRKSPRAPSVRASITPGTVLILLAGRFRGKRVVCLKALESGLLLITGPRKINGVPLRRVNQAYVIATSTKLDISNIKIDPKFNDLYFKAARVEKKAADEDALLASGEKVKIPLPESRIADQKLIDAQILALVKKTPLLMQYLNASFCLSKGQYPHAMKF